MSDSNVRVHDIFSVGSERLDNFLRLSAGVEPIGGKADDQEICHGFREGVMQVAVILVQVEIIYRLGDVQV